MSLSKNIDTVRCSLLSRKTIILKNQPLDSTFFNSYLCCRKAATAESAITIKFKEFQDAVINNDTELAVASADELIVLINDRNQKCKLLK